MREDEQMSKSKSPRYDVTVYVQNPHSVISEGIAADLLKNLAAGRMVLPFEEAIHEDWVEVYCTPGPSAHDPFVKHAYDGEHPIFHEAVIRWGTVPADAQEAGDRSPIYFYFQFRGCLFEEPLGPFRKRFKDVMKSRPVVATRPHISLPEHKVVDPEDAPKNKKLKRGPGPGTAGTRVEEW
tara:strand:- start:147 stop:689 length:543 start_codon:yes stop_codon:yes gene_type:complete